MCKTAVCTIAAARDLAARLAGRARRRCPAPAYPHCRPLRNTRRNLPLGRLEHRRLRHGYYTVTVAANRPSQHSRGGAISFRIANVASVN